MSVFGHAVRESAGPLLARPTAMSARNERSMIGEIL